MRTGDYKPLCFSVDFRCGCGCGHDSDCGRRCLRASSFGCDCRDSGRCDEEATVSPWTANDGAKQIGTWIWIGIASRMIASDCANEILGELWTEKAFCKSMHRDTTEIVVAKKLEPNSIKLASILHSRCNAKKARSFGAFFKLARRGTPGPGACQT